MCTHFFVFICIHCIHYVCVRLDMDIHERSNTCKKPLMPKSINVFLNSPIYIYMCIHTYVYIWVYVNIKREMYMCVFVCSVTPKPRSDY